MSIKKNLIAILLVSFFGCKDIAEEYRAEKKADLGLMVEEDVEGEERGQIRSDFSSIESTLNILGDLENPRASILSQEMKANLMEIRKLRRQASTLMKSSTEEAKNEVMGIKKKLNVILDIFLKQTDEFGELTNQERFGKLQGRFEGKKGRFLELTTRIIKYDNYSSVLKGQRLEIEDLIGGLQELMGGVEDEGKDISDELFDRLKDSESALGKKLNFYEKSINNFDKIQSVSQARAAKHAEIDLGGDQEIEALDQEIDDLIEAAKTDLENRKEINLANLEEKFRRYTELLKEKKARAEALANEMVLRNQTNLVIPKRSSLKKIWQSLPSCKFLISKFLRK